MAKRARGVVGTSGRASTMRAMKTPPPWPAGCTRGRQWEEPSSACWDRMRVGPCLPGSEHKSKPNSTFGEHKAWVLVPQTVGGGLVGRGPRRQWPATRPALLLPAPSSGCLRGGPSSLHLPAQMPPQHSLHGTYCFMARSLESMLSCFPFMSCTSVSSLVTLSWRIFMSSFFSVDTWVPRGNSH